MFKKLKRKIKEKIAVKKLRKECFSAITFNKNTVIKEKSVLIIELIHTTQKPLPDIVNIFRIWDIMLTSLCILKTLKNIHCAVI